MLEHAALFRCTTSSLEHDKLVSLSSSLSIRSFSRIGSSWGLCEEKRALFEQGIDTVWPLISIVSVHLTH